MKFVTVLNYILKGSWEEGGSGGYQKEIKISSTAYL